MEPAAHQAPGSAGGGAGGASGADDTGGAVENEHADGPSGADRPGASGPGATGGGAGPGAPAGAGAGTPSDPDPGDPDPGGGPVGPAGPTDPTVFTSPTGPTDPAGPSGPVTGGIAALSLPARIFVAISVAVVAVAVAFHVAMVFLHIAPDNTVSRQHADVVDSYVLPEFEQNWKLFAPNPLQQNIAVHARATVALENGDTETTGWVNLTAMDGGAIRGNPAPSHTQQNELRRGWEFFTNYHDSKNRAIGLRGELSEQYIKRIVMRRFGPELNGGTVERIQVRSAVTPVAAPEWSDEKINTKTVYRTQPWWPVASADLPKGDQQ